MTVSDRKETRGMPTLTIKQVCEELQVTRRTVFRWIKQGKISVIRLGPKFIRVDQAELDRIKREGL